MPDAPLYYIWINDVQIAPVKTNVPRTQTRRTPQQGGDSITVLPEGETPDTRKKNEVTKPKDIPNIFKSVLLSYGVNRSLYGVVVLNDSTYEYVEETFFRKNLWRIPIEYQFGFGENDLGSRFMSYLVSYVPKFGGSSVEYTMPVTDQIGLLSQSEKLSRSWPAQTPLSTIIADIARKRNWTTTTVDGRSTVETTKYLNRPIIQREQSDMQFIMEEILPYAVSNESGRGGFRMYADPTGVVHFHTQEFLIDGVIREYMVGAVTDGSVLQFEIADTSFAQQQHGGRMTEHRSVDAKTKRLNSYVIDDEGSTGIRPRELEYDIPITRPYNKSGYVTNVSDINAHRDSLENQYFAKSSWYYWADTTVQARIRTQGDPHIYQDDLVNVWIAKPNGSFHYMSGTYQVTNVVHRLNGGQYVTDMFVQKKSVLLNELSDANPKAILKRIKDARSTPRGREIVVEL